MIITNVYDCINDIMNVYVKANIELGHNISIHTFGLILNVR